MSSRSRCRRPRRLPAIALVLTALVATANATRAESPEERGLAIAREADRRDTGFGDYTVDEEMVLRTRNDESSRRVMTMKVLEVPADGDKSLIVFDRPRDIFGTALLTFTHKQGDDDQWLYLPALKRVKRISSANKSGSFVGSEFAYEDLTSQEVEKYTYRYLRDETLDGIDCFVVERYPVDRNSGYKRQVVWVDKAEYRTQKVDFYDRKESLLKTLTFHGYHQYLDRFWRADRMVMVNHQSGKNTELLWSSYEFRTGLSDSDFNSSSLSRAR